MLYFSFCYEHIESFDVQNAKDHDVCVFIPAKNEEATISDCIQSILENSIEPAGITLIDDASTDQTVGEAKRLLRSQDQLLSTHKSGKKNGIDLAVQHTDQTYILTTDGDCIVSQRWLDIQTSALQSSSDLVLGPVFIERPKSLLDYIQQFDLLATMGMTNIGHEKKLFYSGAGANLGFRRSTYEELQPFADNYNIASGDDIFFIEKVIASAGNIQFVKHPGSYVLTKAITNWTGFVQQRVRWAAKSKHYKQNGLNNLWLFIGFSLLCFCVSLILFLIGIQPMLMLTCWIGKCLVDFIFIKKIADYYNQAFRWVFFVPALFIYPFFILLVAGKSLFFNTNSWE